MISSEFNAIARIHNDYVSKFGIPRQSGVIDDNESVIVFEPEYRNTDAIRGLEEYNYVWLIWLFSENTGRRYSPTVRPPRLGGNTRVGVYATRSPYRPNPIGLSSVRISRIDTVSENAPLIYVSGADIMNGTPVLDIKPYIPYADIHGDAVGGFTDRVRGIGLRIVEGLELLEGMPEQKASVLKRMLEQDPRPAYHDNPDRVYSFEYAEYHIEFRVENDVIHILEASFI